MQTSWQWRVTQIGVKLLPFAAGCCPSFLGAGDAPLCFLPSHHWPWGILIRRAILDLSRGAEEQVGWSFALAFWLLPPCQKWAKSIGWEEKHGNRKDVVPSNLGAFPSPKCAAAALPQLTTISGLKERAPPPPFCHIPTAVNCAIKQWPAKMDGICSMFCLLPHLNSGHRLRQHLLVQFVGKPMVVPFHCIDVFVFVPM